MFEICYTEEMNKEAIILQVKQKYEVLDKVLDERSRRIWAGTEAKAIGRGGQLLVAQATGMHKNTVSAGVKEINEKKELEKGRIRKSGGGRKKAVYKDKTLQEDIKKQVESSTLGDPESPLLLSSKSTRKIADALNKETNRISHVSVAKELQNMGYSLQGNRKTKEGGEHPDRDAQFNFINNKGKEFQEQNQPVISVDTKKKELIGNFKNNGKEYHKEGKSPEVNVYDFLDKEKGKVSPYGVYDLDKNKGWVSVGISSDTAEFAVNSIRSWWNEMGKETYSEATALYINADGGGSNGSRCRLWKLNLQILANELNKPIHVSHFPPGTSKWNKIEHRMFCFISQNWRGKPLIDRATVVNLIGRTSTKTGLKIKAKLDENEYQKGIKVSDEELASISIERDEFHGEWNYTISPQKS
jgi:hypothetical protein